MDDCPGPDGALAAAEEPEIAALVKPISGKTIPYWLYDHTIPDLQLLPREAVVLTYLCRRTFGYKRYHGDYIGLSEIAHHCAMDRTNARRVLQVLEHRGLIVRKAQGIDENGAQKAAWIGVILPGFWPSTE